MKKLEKLYKILFVGLPVALYFSYFPVISLGSDVTMNFELSVALIWLVVTVACGVVVLVGRGELWAAVCKWARRKWLWLLFPVWATLSVVWSLNMVRGVLTVGVMWLSVLAVVETIELREIVTSEWVRRWFPRVFIGATLVVCAWCVAQCVMDVMGVSREYTLLCPGCVSQMFGFPHPNGFAIEPQFMGNLLIVPAIVMMWNYVYAGSHFLCSKLSLFCTFVILATLFLTFSRGAIYAFVAGVVVMSVVGVLKKVGWKRLVLIWGMVFAAFVATLNAQGLMAELGPTDDTYFTGITKALNHLSLGTIDVHAAPAAFDGYVEESTDVRVGLTRAALAVWMRDFKTFSVGVGIGGAGEALYQYGFNDSPKEIVQNEYASVLVETGAVGAILALVMVVFGVRFLVQRRMWMIICLVVAYGVSLFFFSGVANALQVYLMPAVLAMIGLSLRKFSKDRIQKIFYLSW